MAQAVLSRQHRGLGSAGAGACSWPGECSQLWGGGCETVGPVPEELADWE